MPRIKVLHLITSLPIGGAEDLIADIITGLAPGRFEVQVACLESPGAIGEELSGAGHKVVNLGLKIKTTPFGCLLSAVRRLLQEIRPHILHTHLYHPNLYGRLAALGLGRLGVVASIHNTYSRVKLHRCLWNFALGRITDCLLVSSPQVYQDVRRYDRVPAAKLRIFPYGIRLEQLEIPETREEVKARLAIPGFCLGVVGRLEEQKGHEFLLKALQEVIRYHPNLTALLVGDGRRRERLEHLSRELGLADNVRFLGTRRDLPRLYRAMDLYVQPSLWEGLPLALLKAMGAGLAVVATRVSGSLHLVQDGVSGRLVPPADSLSLAAAILELGQDSERRRRLGQAARNTVSEHHSLEAMLKQLEELYLELYQKSCPI